ncbi:uncharacterized protein LOC115453642 [Manduca sexta]|nr:uncharacterized protein LOC115453642 [Manduca sexta]
MAAWWFGRVITLFLGVLLAVSDGGHPFVPPSISDSLNVFSSNSANVTNAGTLNEGFNNNDIRLTRSTVLKGATEKRRLEDTGLEWEMIIPDLIWRQQRHSSLQRGGHGQRRAEAAPRPILGSLA